MQKCELRTEIMEKCPEEFEDTLKDFIDKLETLVGEIVNELDIRDISDIGQIEEAHSLADNLNDALY